MRRRIRPIAAFAGVLALVGATAGTVSAHGGQHGPLEGHLIGTGAWGKIQLVGQLRIAGVTEGAISDVAAFGNYAYLGRYTTDDCAGPESGGRDGGVYVVDISNPAAPREVGFIPAHQDTYVSEGVQVVRVTTPAFSGDILVMNQEGCGKNYKAGFSLWDVSNPLEPKKLAQNFGDFTRDGDRNTPHDANQTHSAFIWDAGSNAYLVTTDDEEATDVDIFDITNPKKPRLIAEYDLNQFPIAQEGLRLREVFLHDMVVKNIGGRWIMLLSYWDGGFVKLDVTDPRNAIFLGDTDYATQDPEYGTLPEGNAHQAEFTADNRYFIGTDEDFAPFGLVDETFTFNGTPYVGVEGAFTTPIYTLPGRLLTGPVVWTGGVGCTPEELPPAPTPDSIALIQRGVCFFQDKAESADAQSYAGFIVATDAARPDEVFPMAPRDAGPYPDIPGFMVSYATGEALKTAAVGVPGGTIVARGEFNGWGYIHLFDATTMAELDTFVIPEAKDPQFGRGFGDLTVHEVATDPTDPDLAYLSYYAGGLRALRIVNGQLVEVGGYLDPLGNNFWGVEVHTLPSGRELILASDRDSGLWIFEDP